MCFRTALISLLLFCPCALCYGQLRFASVGGEKGYSAMRASFEADLDKGWILTPKYRTIASFCARRLNNQNIFVINLERINVVIMK